MVFVLDRCCGNPPDRGDSLLRLGLSAHQLDSFLAIRDLIATLTRRAELGYLETMVHHFGLWLAVGLLLVGCWLVARSFKKSR
jgi:hypothetical protein